MRLALAVASLALLSLPFSAHASGNAAELTQAGYELFLQNEQEQAIASYGAAITTDPTFLRAYELRAIAYMGQRDCSRAILDFDKVITTNPSPLRLVMRGGCKASTGRLQDGLADADAALALAPNDPVALNLRSNILKAIRR